MFYDSNILGQSYITLAGHIEILFPENQSKFGVCSYYKI